MLSHDDERQITATLTRYATGIDSRDWALLATCFTDDAHGDYGAFGQFRSGREIVDFMRPAHEDMGPTLHRLSNMVISGDGDRATARTYVDALLTAKDPAGETHRGIGVYDDELVRTTDGWRISRRKFTPVQLG